jgi:hypothetical protein
VIERSFDDVMDRASGWYKRRVQLILFVLALGLVCVINADSAALAQRLWKDDALRAAVVSQAKQSRADGPCGVHTGRGREARRRRREVRRPGERVRPTARLVA